MVSAELQDLYGQRDAIDAALDLTPDEPELLAIRSELVELITDLEGTEAPPPPPPIAEPAPKWDKSKHPAFAKQAQQAVVEEPAPVTYRQNDTILAKWAKDKQFYEARITSITGSAADPVYLVKFLKYNEQAQLRRHEIRPIPQQQSKKRKADDTPVATPPPSAQVASLPANVIAAAPTVDPALAAQVKEGKTLDAQSRGNKALRQMPKSKTLNNAKNSWQAFQQKGKGKGSKKESMFRTQEGNPNARVGFTGSGQDMRKDAARVRNKYEDQNWED